MNQHFLMILQVLKFAILTKICEIWKVKIIPKIDTGMSFHSKVPGFQEWMNEVSYFLAF